MPATDSIYEAMWIGGISLVPPGILLGAWMGWWSWAFTWYLLSAPCLLLSPLMLWMGVLDVVGHYKSDRSTIKRLERELEEAKDLLWRRSIAEQSIE
jgi:hypothetical protein